MDDDGVPFQLDYRLAWHPSTLLLSQATLTTCQGGRRRSLTLAVDEDGQWRDADSPLPQLDGCLDIDIWPTPLTNSFPIRRSRLRIGERRAFRMAWVRAPALSVEAKSQAYTRIAERTYRFEDLSGDGFMAELQVDEAGLVLDYPGLFERVAL